MNAVIRTAVTALAALYATALYAAPQDALKPLLADLKGYTAEAAEGADMNMMGMSMTTATRSYEKGDVVLSAVIMVGTSAMMQGQMPTAEIEADGVKAVMGDVDGFQVMRAYSKEENSGYVIVTLHTGGAKGASFMLSFEGMGLNAGLKTAQQFDWAAMKKTTAGLVK